MDVTNAASPVSGTTLDVVPLPGRQRGALFWGSAGVVAALMGLLLVAVLRPATVDPQQVLNRPATVDPQQVLNRPAPDFRLPLYGGGTLHLATLRGKTVMVNFWWSGCIPCQEEAPLLERQWRAWKDRGVIFVGVDEIDDPQSATPRAFLRRYGITYPNVWDTSAMDIEYGTTGQPESFFITRRGLISEKYAQPFPDDQTLARLMRETRAS